ncbi:MAG: hypothetical protein MUC77_18340 [Chromatiaceae bacterium]|jgi:hypothetical protein|nr:hypothetical protein [Chromatiaceae bacterium]
MQAPNTETLTVRLVPEVKAALRQAAEQEHRSLANMLEVMIRDWCRGHLAVPPAPPPMPPQE